jgi:hypothetical protein
MSRVQDILLFLGTLASNWAAFMTGGIPAALFLAFERFRGHQLSWLTFFVVFIVFGFAAASYQTWHDEYFGGKEAQSRANDVAVLRDKIAQLEKQQRDDTKLYQDNKIVAVVGNVAVDAGRQTVVFPIVTSERDLDMTKGFEFREWKLVCSGQPAGSMSFGAFRQIQYPNVLCHIVGAR